MIICPAPWQWNTNDPNMPYWDAPEADKCIGRLDLRSLPQCGQAGGFSGLGLFVYDTAPALLDTLGDLRDTLPLLKRRALARALEITDDIPDMTVLDTILYLFNQRADPTGQFRWKPLRGSRRSPPRLMLANREVWRGKLDDVLANTIAVFREDYKALKAECLKTQTVLLKDGVTWDWVEREVKEIQQLLQLGLEPTSSKVAAVAKYAIMTPPYHHKKVTGAKMQALWGRMGDDLLEPLLGVYATDGWENPGTVKTESFPGTSDTFGGDQTWTETNGDWDNVSDQGSMESQNILADARMEFAFSDDALYAQVSVESFGADAHWVGPAINFAAGARDYYVTFPYTSDNKQHLRKVVGGTESNVATAVSITISLPEIYKVSNDGAGALVGYQAGVQRISGTDTALTNLYTGLAGYKNQANAHLFDNFEAGDLGAVIFYQVAGGTATLAGTLGRKTSRTLGTNVVTMAGSLNRKTSISLTGVMTMTSTLGRTVSIAIGGAVTSAGALGLKTLVSVGAGAVAMAGTLGRLIQLAVGGALASTGTLGRSIMLAVGAGAVAVASTLGRLTMLAVGAGAVAMVGVLVSVSGLFLQAVGQGAVAMAGTLSGIMTWIERIAVAFGRLGVVRMAIGRMPWRRTRRERIL